MKILISVIITFCFSAQSYSQNLGTQLKKNAWISSSNDRIVFKDSTLLFLNYVISYKIDKDRLVVYNLHEISHRYNQTDSVELGKVIYEKDSIILKLSKPNKNIDYIFSAYISISKYIDKVYGSEITFFNEIKIDELKKVLFKEVIIAWYGASLRLDSVGQIEINSNNYNPYFRVNNGTYTCKLDSANFSEVQNIIFKSGIYSIPNNLSFHFNSSRTDGIRVNYTIRSKVGSFSFESNNYNQELINNINAILINDDLYKTCNLQKIKIFDDSVFFQSHNVVKVDKIYLANGVESVSGEITLVEQLKNNNYLYQLKVDSNYAQRNVNVNFQKNQKIYGISNKKIDEGRIGLIVQTKNSAKYSFLKRRKTISYFTIIDEFDPNKSVFFDYYGEYSPIGFSSSNIIMKMSSPAKKSFNKVENKIYKLIKTDRIK